MCSGTLREFTIKLVIPEITGIIYSLDSKPKFAIYLSEGEQVNWSDKRSIK